MMKQRKVLFAVIGLFLLLFFPFSLAAQDEPLVPPPVGLRPDAPAYALHGPYWVGTYEFVVDPDSEQPMPVTAWYPALNPDGAQEAVTYYVLPENADMTIAGHALLDGAPDASAAPYPLVILSHGSGGTRFIAPYYAEHLASYGFIVLAPDHFGDLMTAESQTVPYLLYHRPLDVSRLIDAAAEQTAVDGFLKDMIDAEHVGVTGISFGGYTSLMAGGATINLSTLATYCDAFPADSVCVDILQSTEALATVAELDAVPDANWPSWGDARVDAIVPIVPGPGVIAEGAEGVTVPTLLVLASGDTVALPEYNGYPLWENLGSSSKTLVEFMNAEHPFAVFACADAPWLGAMAYPVCADPVWDMARIHDLLNHYSTAFLLDELKGDADAHAALMPEAAQFVGVRYDTTLK